MIFSDVVCEGSHNKSKQKSCPTEPVVFYVIAFVILKAVLLLAQLFSLDQDFNISEFHFTSKEKTVV